MTIVEKAAQFMEQIAADNSHGYDQAQRWGPDYDCSSLVISAYRKAGVPLQSTYTGNMKNDFISHGFKDVSKDVNMGTGAGLIRGDVLLNERKHTAMYIGNGKIVQASGNEFGGITGGKPGDQTGREIAVSNYYNMPWDCILRYKEQNTEAPTHGADEPYEDAVENEDYYIVKYGDSLSSIAERFLGAWNLYPLIKQANCMTSDDIYPGMMLLLHPEEQEKVDGASDESESPKPEEPIVEEPAETPSGAYIVPMRVLKNGDTGTDVKQVQRLIIATGYKMPKYGADGEFGAETEKAVKKFQKAEKLEVNGAVDRPTMTKLLGL